MRVTDALGRDHSFDATPQRLVSLVPSLTETLFSFGLGGHVVGVTDFCVHPEEGLRGTPRVGGTKNPHCGRILSLRPDLVLANKEENRRRDVDHLESRGLAVFVTYPRTFQQALDELRALASLLDRESAAGPMLDEIERTWLWARERRPERPPRVVSLIWKAPYMAVGQDTFASDLLHECGAENPFPGDKRRYPRVDEAEIEAAQPDVILLPTEPYAFEEKDRQERLRLDCPAARNGRIHIVEGELLTWYGPRMGRALQLFSRLLAPEAPPAS